METTNEKCSICESKLIWNSALSTESFNKFYCETEDCEFGYIGIPTKNYIPKPPKIKKESETFKWLMFGFITLCLVIFFIITSEPKQTNQPSKFHSWNLPERPPTASEMRDIYGD